MKYLPNQTKTFFPTLLYDLRSVWLKGEQGRNGRTSSLSITQEPDIRKSRFLEKGEQGMPKGVLGIDKDPEAYG